MTTENKLVMRNYILKYSSHKNINKVTSFMKTNYDAVYLY